ncbi:MAG TPA: hypothetical protein VN436_02045, partial [Holophaga sp.]|nr:hypothetical protein [Holophaga sp.]
YDRHDTVAIHILTPLAGSDLSSLTIERTWRAWMCVFLPISATILVAIASTHLGSPLVQSIYAPALLPACEIFYLEDVTGEIRDLAPGPPFSFRMD